MPECEIWQRLGVMWLTRGLFSSQQCLVSLSRSNCQGADSERFPPIWGGPWESCKHPAVWRAAFRSETVPVLGTLTGCEGTAAARCWYIPSPAGGCQTPCLNASPLATQPQWLRAGSWCLSWRAYRWWPPTRPSFRGRFRSCTNASRLPQIISSSPCQVPC